MSHTRWHIFGYDIANDRTRTKVHRLLSREALHLQKSVFMLHASQQRADELLREIGALIDPDSDDVRSYHIGDPERLWLAGKSTTVVFSTAKQTTATQVEGFFARLIRVIRAH